MHALTSRSWYFVGRLAASQFEPSAGGLSREFVATGEVACLGDGVLCQQSLGGRCGDCSGAQDTGWRERSLAAHQLVGFPAVGKTFSFCSCCLKSPSFCLEVADPVLGFGICGHRYQLLHLGRHMLGQDFGGNSLACEACVCTARLAAAASMSKPWLRICDRVSPVRTISALVWATMNKLPYMSYLILSIVTNVPALPQKVCRVQGN